jgi:hypothetical protein
LALGEVALGEVTGLPPIAIEAVGKRAGREKKRP